MKVSGHVTDRAKSRWYDIEFAMGRSMCEFCPLRTDKERKTVEQVHHNTKSMRWRKKHNKDGSDLLGVCSKCHTYIHNHYTDTLRHKIQNIIKIVTTYTQKIQEMWYDSQELLWKNKKQYLDSILFYYWNWWDTESTETNLIKEFCIQQ